MDTAPIDIACCTSDDTADSEADNDGDVLEEWRAKHLGENDADEGQEAETDELWRAPEKGPGRKRGWAQLENPRRRTALAIVGASAPIWDTRRTDERGTNHHNNRACIGHECAGQQRHNKKLTGHHRREYALENTRRDERHEDFQECANHRCSYYV